MKELNDAIESMGLGLSGGVVRVDMFLNHRVDTGMLTRMGEEFLKAFGKEHVDLILTIESSGIPIALTTAQAFGNIPMVIAKKGMPSNLDDESYESRLLSYTRGLETSICVSKAYLLRGARVLIIDDFLANGEAARALIDIIGQAGASVAGIGVCIEKSFQSGGSALRAAGFKVVALATVTGVCDGRPVLLQK